MNNERETLTIGALIHDIGKLVRRAGLAEKSDPHTLAGSIFVRDVEVNGVKIFAPYQDFIFKHHEKDLDQTKPLTWYVCFADNIASSERMTSRDEGYEERRTLENVLSRVHRDKLDVEISYFKPGIMPKIDLPTPTDRKSTDQDFRRLYEGLVKEAKKIPLTVENLRYLLYKYLSFVPQSTEKFGIMDISLYDHLKVTAMISLSLYDYVEKKELKISKYEDLKKLKGEPVLLLVEGDVSGIQKFIKNVSSKGALRSFRGRSVFIDLFQEIVVDEILQAIGFFRTNVHFVGGGHFYIVISNTEENVERLKQVKKKVNEWLLNRSSDLKLVIAWEPMTLAEVEDPSDAFERLKKNIQLSKLRMYSSEELKRMFDVDSLKMTARKDFRTCKVCGRRVEALFALREDQEPVACDFCKQMYEFGRQIMRAEYFSEDPKGDFEILGQRYSFSRIPKPGKNYVLGIKEIEHTDEAQYIFIDMASYAKYEELEEIAKESKGKKLACFQADLDKLGEIIRNGLEKKTLSRISTLSRLLTYFFKYRVLQIAEEKNIVIVYSGGDDLFILGGWEDVLDFIYQMQKDFRKFTGGNPNMTYTASFVLFDEKETISKIKDMAEQMENLGKEKRNCLVFSHGLQRTIKNGREKIEKAQIVSWEDFTEKTYAAYQELSQLVESVDRSIIRKALSLSLEDSPMNKAFLAYIEARESEKDSEFARLIRTREIPALNSILQLIDLKARRER